MESESSFLAMVCCMILMEELINLITSWFFAVYPANGLSNCNPNWQFEKEVSLSNTVMRDDHCYLRFQCPIYCCNQHNYLGYHVCISFPFHGFGLISEPCVVCLSRNHILKLPVILCDALNNTTSFHFLIMQTCLVPAKRAIQVIAHLPVQDHIVIFVRLIWARPIIYSN